MLKDMLSILVTLALALGLGTWSVWHALDTQGGIGALQSGPWTAYPEIGTADADPYSG